jgi:type II secretory pathway component GspD/PulD (secretin)
VVRDIDRGRTDAEELITHFDTQTPQILIEASIVEASENFVRDLGIQWGYTYKASPEPECPGVNFNRINTGGGLGTGVGQSRRWRPHHPRPVIADFPASSVAGSARPSASSWARPAAPSLAARLTALSVTAGKIIAAARRDAQQSGRQDRASRSCASSCPAPAR